MEKGREKKSKDVERNKWIQDRMEKVKYGEMKRQRKYKMEKERDRERK